MTQPDYFQLACNITQSYREALMRQPATEEHATPGPWRATQDGIAFSGSAGFTMTPWGNNLPISIADRRLIAAAPAMREAIEHYVADLDPGDESYGMRAVLRAIEGA